jgi:cellulose synthase/poly-beta-1,6-N-acetylglucosamine synthase-like glycosyltransferase
MRRATSNKTNQSLKKFSIIVPIYNEVSFIKQKMKNLLSLDYPKNKFQIIFVDGGSTDGSLELINQNNIKLIKANGGNKIRDINIALSKIKSDYILITDADSIIDRLVLMRFNNILSYSDIGAVGAYTRPGKSIKKEIDFWNVSNNLRILENNYFSTSSLVAACYAFKYDLIRKFPEDVIADDLYVTYKILSKKHRVFYDVKSEAIENRTPSNLDEMIRHKLRKGHADIREISRFLFTSKKNNRWRLIFTTKLLQTVVTPIILIPFILISILYIYINPMIVFFIICLSLITLFLVPKDMIAKMNILSKLELFLFVNILLFLIIISYPFSKHTSTYKKINSQI